MKPAARSILAVFCLALATQPCGAQKAAPKKTLRALVRVFKTKKTTDNYRQRRSVLRKLEGSQGEDLIRALVKAYERLDAEALPIRRERGEVLDTRTSLEVARFRKKLDPIDKLQDAILEILAAQSEAHADVMLDELITQLRKPEAIFSLVVRLAEKCKGFKDVDTLRRALARSRDVPHRIALVRVVETLGKRGRLFTKWLERLLDSESETLRLEAVRALATVDARDAVPQLIAMMSEATGRLQERIAAALHRLTGLGHGLDARAWKAWLDGLGEGAPIPAPSGTVAAPPARKTMGTYFTIAQEGRTLHYIFDRSDSMERGLPNGGVRIRKARSELSRAIRALTPDTRFKVISYSIKVRPWESGLQLATKANVLRARKWLFDLDLQAGTSSYDAIERSFRLAGSRGIDRFDELEVETMFFLSDGEPTRRTGGTIKPLVRDDPLRILSAVRRWNPIGRVKVHAIGLALATSGAPLLMRGLAEQNGGQFVAIR